MGKMNWNRIILGGLLAAVVMMVLAILNMETLQRPWLDAALELLGARTDADWWRFFAALGILCLVGGIMSVWLYAAIRPRYGPGPKTAAIVGFASWLLTSTVDWFWASTGLVPSRGLMIPLLAYLPILIVVAISGAWL
ncbi:hypothetical protein ACFL3S_03490, partial [Gemmatimonadota bacterium]